MAEYNNRNILFSPDVNILSKTDAILSNTPGTSNEDGYTQRAVNSIVQNPNLLINPNFAINQRGQTSYSGVKYTVDRWKSRYDKLTVGVLASGVRLTSTQSSGTIYLRQRFEENLAGKTVTLSCKISAIQSGTGGRIMMNYGTTTAEPTTYINGVAFSNSGIVSLTVTIPANAASFAVDIGVAPNSSIDVEWAKLEIGSVATEFSPPDNATELLKCQRYYQKIELHGAGMTAAQTTRIYPIISLPVTMRVKPTITVITNPDIRGNGKNYVLTDNDSIVTDNIFDNGVRILVLTATAQFTPNQVYCLANGVAALDAEI